MKRLLVGILFGGACMYWFAHTIDWSEMILVFRQIRVSWVGLSVILLLVEFVIRAFRWKIILRSMTSEISVLNLFRAQVIGAAANTLLPLRLGEIIKPTIVCNRTTLDFVPVATTSIVERVYDLLGMVSVLVIMVLFLQPELTPAPDQQVLIDNLELYGGLLGLAAVVSMGIFFTLTSQKEAARPIFLRITSIAPEPIQNFFMRLFDGFVKGLGNTTDTSGLWLSGLLSVAMWLNGAFAIFCLFKAFSLTLPFGAACFISVAIALSVALPQAPGFVGVFHVAIETTLLLWGQDSTIAQGFALIFWAVSFVPVTFIGVGFAFVEDIDWRSLIKQEKTPSA
jgi:uncharacterized protein (TIRG00374 family)